MEIVKVRGIRATVTESARGYVEVSARGRRTVAVDMDPYVKDRILALQGAEHDRAWRREMQVLRTWAIARARREWR